MFIFNRTSTARHQDGQRAASFKLRAGLFAGLAVLSLGAFAPPIHVLNGNAAPRSALGVTHPDNLSARASTADMPSFADLVDKVKHAVVSVRVRAEARTDLASGGKGLNPFEGTPLERFFKGLPGGNRDPGRLHPAPKRYIQAIGSGFLITADGC